MLKFKEFLAFVEMTDVTNDTTDDVTLTKQYGGTISYNFIIDNENYEVVFSPTSLHDDDDYSRLVDKGYSITLQGPKGYSPTGKGNGPTIYRQLIKAVRKVVAEEKPEGLSFYGAVPAQDIMYGTFYERFLKSAFTKIDKKNYIRNDLIKQWQETNDPRFRKIQKSMQELERIDPVGQAKKQKLAQREKIRGMGNLVGKIVWNDDYSSPAYVISVEPPAKVKNAYWDYNGGRTTSSSINYIRNLTDDERNDYRELIKKLIDWVMKNYNRKPIISSPDNQSQPAPVISPSYQHQGIPTPAQPQSHYNTGGWTPSGSAQRHAVADNDTPW